METFLGRGQIGDLKAAPNGDAASPGLEKIRQKMTVVEEEEQEEQEEEGEDYDERAGERKRDFGMSGESECRR